MQINKANLDFLFQDWDQRYQAAFQAQPLLWPEYATMMPSGSEQSVHSWLASLPGMREWTGARVVNNVVARDYTLRNKKFELTVGLDVDRIKDDTYNLFGPTVDQIGVQTAQWPDDVMTPIVEAGNANACWDGQTFFDTDHPVDLDDSTKGTFSNNLVGAAYDFESDPHAVWQAVEAAGSAFIDENGRPHGITFDSIMIPTVWKRQGLELADAAIIAKNIQASAVNVGGAGVSNVYIGKMKVIVNPKMSNSSPYGIAMCTTRGVKPFIWQLREAPTLVSRNAPTDPSVFDANQVLYGASGRGAGGYGLPFLAIRFAPA